MSPVQKREEGFFRHRALLLRCGFLPVLLMLLATAAAAQELGPPPAPGEPLGVPAEEPLEPAERLELQEPPLQETPLQETPPPEPDPTRPSPQIRERLEPPVGLGPTTTAAPRQPTLPTITLRSRVKTLEGNTVVALEVDGELIQVFVPARHETLPPPRPDGAAAASIERADRSERAERPEDVRAVVRTETGEAGRADASEPTGRGVEAAARALSAEAQERRSPESAGRRPRLTATSFTVGEEVIVTVQEVTPHWVQLRLWPHRQTLRLR